MPISKLTSPLCREQSPLLTTGMGITAANNTVCSAVIDQVARMSEATSGAHPVFLSLKQFTVTPARLKSVPDIASLIRATGLPYSGLSPAAFAATRVAANSLRM
jgi:hypothetical protein